MPELPEVEIIRRGLEKYIVRRTIEDVEILSPKQFIGDLKNVIGAEIIGVRRLGKGIVIDLSSGLSVVIHLKMTGQLIYVAGPVGRFSRPTSSLASLFAGARREPLTPATHYSINKYTHVVFKLKAKIQNSKFLYSYLYYNDIRKFGWVRVVKTNRLMELPFFGSLGPEPLRDLDLKNFKNILASSRQPIKLLLMDQSKIAGLGNIYANEALFVARIHPMRPASGLASGEAKRLLEAMERVLQKGIEMGGSSMANYVNALGEKGEYQEQFLVYDREGEKCLECKGVIRRIKMGGRGTFYCERCQK